MPKGYKDPIIVSSIDGVGTKSIVVENLLGVNGYYNLGYQIFAAMWANPTASSAVDLNKIKDALKHFRNEYKNEL